MSDRTYTWIATPLSALTASQKPLVAGIFQTSLENLLLVLAEPALPDEALGQDDLAVRLVDGVPCLVWEDVEADRGGADLETELQAAGIPYLLRHNAGEEYGPGRTVWMGKWCVTIRPTVTGSPSRDSEWSRAGPRRIPASWPTWRPTTCSGRRCCRQLMLAAAVHKGAIARRLYCDRSTRTD